MSPTPHTVPMPDDSSAGLITSQPNRKSISPSLYAVIGFLVYWGLFASYGWFADAANDLPSNEAWKRLGGIVKLIIFAATMLTSANRAASNRKPFAIGGAIIAFGASILFLLVQDDMFGHISDSSVIVRLLLEGVEAFGEALVTAGLVAFVRVESTDRDWEYFRSTTWLRIGQNIGMVMAVLVGHWFGRNDKGYAFVLVIVRVTALVLIFRLIGNTLPNSVPSVLAPRPRSQVFRVTRFPANVIIGASSYALFYLVTLGSPLILGDRNRWVYLTLNGVFAVFAMLAIFLLSPTAAHGVYTRERLLKFQIYAALAAFFVIVMWLVAVWRALDGSHGATFVKFTVGALGFCTTSTYVIGELSAGLHGRTDNRSGQIVSYLAAARFGPVAALLMIYTISLLPPGSILGALSLGLIVALCGALLLAAGASKLRNT